MGASGPNQVAWPGLLELPAQHAAVSELSQHLVPDWSSVAPSVDTVHLSWAGFITTEGIVDVSGDGVAVMLRYWGSERSLWLADRFGEPEPLAAPASSGRVDGETGASAASDDTRQAGRPCPSGPPPWSSPVMDVAPFTVE